MVFKYFLRAELDYWYVFDKKITQFSSKTTFLAAGMSFWLPETMGKPMTQTIEEAESSYYSDKQKGDYVLGMFSLF